MEPRPTREDIPADASAADVLFELRLHTHEWRQWRTEVNGDLGFLRRFRIVTQFALVVLGVALPVATFVVMVTR